MSKICLPLNSCSFTSAEISEKTALTPSEVHGVINGFLSSVPKYMLLGYKVRLNGLGIFRYAFSGTGKATSEEVSHTDIKDESPPPT